MRSRLGLAAALGGSWCLAGVGVSESAPNAGLAARNERSARRGGEGESDERVLAPLLWGDVAGAAQARAAARAEASAERF